MKTLSKTNSFKHLEMDLHKMKIVSQPPFCSFHVTFREGKWYALNRTKSSFLKAYIPTIHEFRCQIKFTQGSHVWYIPYHPCMIYLPPFDQFFRGCTPPKFNIGLKHSGWKTFAFPNLGFGNLFSGVNSLLNFGRVCPSQGSTSLWDTAAWSQATEKIREVFDDWRQNLDLIGILIVVYI